MYSHSRLLLLFLILLGSLAWTALAQEPRDPVRGQGARWLTVHDYGIQVRVEAPQQPHTGWVVRVRDLGPQVDHLKMDLAPTAARMQLLGYPPLHLQPQGQGEWLTEVPRDWLVGGIASVQMKVLHHGSTLLDTSIRGLFL